MEVICAAELRSSVIETAEVLTKGGGWPTPSVLYLVGEIKEKQKVKRSHLSILFR